MFYWTSKLQIHDKHWNCFYFLCVLNAVLTKQRFMIFPVWASGARMVPRTMGSRYSDTADLSGNWAGFTMMISSLPRSCRRTTSTLWGSTGKHLKWSERFCILPQKSSFKVKICFKAVELKLTSFLLSLHVFLYTKNFLYFIPIYVSTIFFQFITFISDN